MSDLRARFGLILALALLPILLSSIYIAISRGEYGLIVVSFMAWVFAYAAIWLATDRLVFVHLRRIRIASNKFSRGDMSARVEGLKGAPKRIEELANAFDNMAENVREREVRILDNLSEKEVLLREIHHRVKNNLQIIISLLNMQERKLSDASSIAAISEIRGRINAIALVHRGLYEGEDLRVIDMSVFLSRLVLELQKGLTSDQQAISVELDVPPLQLESDTALPVALFVVEAMTNAMKNGLQSDGAVIIEMSKGEEKSKVSVSNNGGCSVDQSVKGTGAKLMKGFARQLSGTFESEDTIEGFRLTLTF